MSDSPLATTGRFAPSPTGPLHMGSLFTAVASFLHATRTPISSAHSWLIRIEDVDRERCSAEHSKRIVQSLQAHALWPTSAVRVQSEHLDTYRRYAKKLLEGGHAYYCSCTRASIAAYNSANGLQAGHYPGLCRRKQHSSGALRLRVDTATGFDDLLQGYYKELPHGGDPVLIRADGTVNYVLSCALDDALQQVDEVVRGVDLIHLTSVQLHMMRVLQLPEPRRYAHLPVLIHNDQKLSKQNRATPLIDALAHENLAYVFQLLGIDVPLDTAENMLKSAAEHFDLLRLKGLQFIEV